MYNWAEEAKKAREIARAAMQKPILEDGPVQVAEWVHPRTKQVRYYVQNIDKVIGLELDFYKSGNVCTAWLDGEKISNSKAEDLRQVKIWYDEVASIHVDRLSDKASIILSEDDIKAKFIKLVNEHNELAKAGKVAPLPVLGDAE